MDGGRLLLAAESSGSRAAGAGLQAGPVVQGALGEGTDNRDQIQMAAFWRSNSLTRRWLPIQGVRLILYLLGISSEALLLEAPMYGEVVIALLAGSGQPAPHVRQLLRHSSGEEAGVGSSHWDGGSVSSNDLVI